MKYKKITSLLLVITVFISIIIPSVSASNYEITYEPLPNVKEGYKRYYFLMPDEWYNEYTGTAGIYWWLGTDSQEQHPGKEANKTNVPNVYYYDVPDDVTEIMWNNYLDGGTDRESQIYNSAFTTTDISLEFYEGSKNYELFKDLTDFENMIYVVDIENSDNDSFRPNVFFGDWYYYYGEGEYGTTPTVNDIVECNRYYFLMPDEWYTEYTDNAGIYWWEGTNALSEWPGMKANKADSENVYYYDVPKDVTTIIWNNYLDLLMEDKESVMHLDYQTVNITMSSPDEYEGMIYVINPNLTTENPFNNKKVYEGDWYKYLGNGEYEATDILGDANEDNELNIKDATIIQKHLANILTLSERSKILADFNDSGDVNIKDATAIQKHLAGIAE